MSMLSGLSGLGLGKLESADLFTDVEEKKSTGVGNSPSSKEPRKPVIEDYVFMKSYTCPVCGSQFKCATVKSGKAKLVGTDLDLRTRYEPVDPHKYDIVACDKCGYAALSRYFDKITSPQAKLVKADISSNFRGISQSLNPTYDDALVRYRLAIAGTIVKKARASEKAYTCMKMAWIVRAKAEDLNPDVADYDQQIQELKDDELELLTNALNGFIAARQSENFPIAGMDEITFDYLISAIAVKIGKYDIATKIIPNILVSRTANNRLKDKARELKEIIMQNKQ